jgi:hypothetical protein
MLTLVLVALSSVATRSPITRRQHHLYLQAVSRHININSIKDTLNMGVDVFMVLITPTVVIIRTCQTATRLWRHRVLLDITRAQTAS